MGIEDDGNAFESCIPQSIKFVEAEAQGLYIGEYEPGGNAHHAVRRLCEEVLDFFTLPPLNSSNTEKSKNKTRENA